MNQDEVIAKLAPAIGLRRQLDPRAAPEHAIYAGPILHIRPLQPAERAFTDETLDTILAEQETSTDRDYPYGLVAASGAALALIWFPGLTPVTIRLLAKGISVLTGRPTTYVQIFIGTAEQIIAAIVAAKQADAWSDDDLAR